METERSVAFLISPNGMVNRGYEVHIKSTDRMTRQSNVAQSKRSCQCALVTINGLANWSLPQLECVKAKDWWLQTIRSPQQAAPKHNMHANINVPSHKDQHTFTLNFLSFRRTAIFSEKHDPMSTTLSPKLNPPFENLETGTSVLFCFVCLFTYTWSFRETKEGCPQKCTTWGSLCR